MNMIKQLESVRQTLNLNTNARKTKTLTEPESGGTNDNNIQKRIQEIDPGSQMNPISIVNNLYPSAEYETDEVGRSQSIVVC